LKLSSIQVDAAAIEAGQWVGNIPELEDLELKVRGVDNEAWRRLRATLVRAVPRNRRRDGNLSVEDNDRITSTLLLDTCLLDWKGIEDETGAAIAYSKDMARDLLFKPENRKFRDAVLYAASLVGEQNAEDEQADAGN
jgi:hypothetical protein